MANKRSQKFAGVRIPYPYGVVLAPTCDLAAVGAKNDNVYIVRMSYEYIIKLSRLRVPKPDGLVPASTDKCPTVRRKSNAQHGIRVPRDTANLVS